MQLTGGQAGSAQQAALRAQRRPSMPRFHRPKPRFRGSCVELRAKI